MSALVACLLALMPLAASATPLFPVAVATPTTAAHWNACLSIHWRFSTAGAPAGGLALAKADVATIAKASGTTWVFDGTTKATPTGAYLLGSSRKAVLIGWTTRRQSSLLAGVPAGVVAETKTVWTGGMITGAAVALNRDSVLALTGGGSWQTTLLHELGHVMGLHHSANPHDLMYPKLNKSLRGLQAGDLVRLHALPRCV